ncbi:MAG: hypothetical protein N4J56_005105 [Chroococcidiopsis sp. SAG 2025]|nr:hypothetical protein [Chroococcidiopsis sp. SAG 2025]
MELTATEAQQLAFNFLMEDLNIFPEDREWFAVLSSRFIGESWYVVEIGVEGLPDKWLIQVYDTRECDPSYTFSSPIRTVQETELQDLPEGIAQVLMLEHQPKSEL